MPPGRRLKKPARAEEKSERNALWGKSSSAAAKAKQERPQNLKKPRLNLTDYGGGKGVQRKKKENQIFPAKRQRRREGARCVPGRRSVEGKGNKRFSKAIGNRLGETSLFEKGTNGGASGGPGEERGGGWGVGGGGWVHIPRLT